MTLEEQLDIILLSENISYGCVMAYLPAELSKEIKDFSKQIDKKDLADDGTEDEPHVTIKYGVHTSDTKIVKDIFKNQPPFNITLGKMSIFKANEDRNSDVLKIELDDEILHDLNKLVNKSTECTTTYNQYKPHVTIAYLKPGTANKYISDKFNGKTVNVDKLVYSDANKNKSTIKLI